jgi:hypothetical protein
MAKQKPIVLENIYNVMCAMSLGIKINENIFRRNCDAQNLIYTVNEALDNSVRETLKSDIFDQHIL